MFALTILYCITHKHARAASEILNAANLDDDELELFKVFKVLVTNESRSTPVCLQMILSCH